MRLGSVMQFTGRVHRLVVNSWSLRLAPMECRSWPHSVGKVVSREVLAGQGSTRPALVSHQQLADEHIHRDPAGRDILPQRRNQLVLIVGVVVDHRKAVGEVHHSARINPPQRHADGALGLYGQLQEGTQDQEGHRWRPWRPSPRPSADGLGQNGYCPCFGTRTASRRSSVRPLFVTSTDWEPDELRENKQLK